MQKIAAYIWLTFVIGICYVAWLKEPHFESSITSLLPQSEQSQYREDAVRSQSEAMGQLLTLTIQHHNVQQAQQATETIRNILSESSILIEQSPSSLQQQPMNAKYRYSVLSSHVYKNLKHKQFDKQSAFALGQLFNPVASAPIDLIRDPFSLYSSYLQDSPVVGQFKIQQGLFRLTTQSEPTFALFYRLSDNAFSLSTQSQLEPLLERIIDYKKTNKVALKMSGLVIHASHGTKQAKQEISTIGIGSLIGIILLILVTFRCLKPLLYILLPISIGTLISLAITTLIFPRVHLITFAFGAGLVGVAVDYSMHYICAQSGQKKNRLSKALLVGLLLGLISSVLAYAGLALTPFPGLRQIAVFSSVGLISSWITVILWLPLASDLTHMTLHSHILNICQRLTPTYSQQRRKLATLIILVLSFLGAYIICVTPANDGLKSLQTSTSDLLNEDRAVQKAIGNTYQSTFLLITAPDLEALIQQEEQTRLALNHLKKQGKIDNYQSVSQSLPSYVQQQRNLELVSKLYDSQLTLLMSQIGVSPDVTEQAQQFFNQNQSILTFEVWQNSPLGQLMANQLIHHDDGYFSSIVRFQGKISDSTKQILKQFASESSSVEFIDPIADISNTLKLYRIQLTTCLLAAYLVVSGLLFIRYRKELWKIILPPLAASIISFAIATLINGGYNLFNITALILVFGIGLDMGIFIKESNGAIHTWIAVTLSTITSLLAFGLLILSKTPVLYQFGIIVLPGLLVVWVLTPFVQPVSYGKNRNE
ncbi:MMPL family transporter [Marinomonas posidonica]|uniref:Membrane transport protein MMPL domain-containing protein n=1 Tax=Marinomonas posidonica (strain CECT 7376 / NCIMB 14433 / IVIA-Po-181) TaxID=491952 RepID=F6CZV0_MARPP|nr:hypothetical protein [Marinomonas posidonica]AEF53611.1 hypothetical protein Mar181_0551 [Marinomonas posidonica IVIA-Po-181]